MNKLPPIEKVYEAYSAVAAGRVTMHENHAIVSSSDRSKEYTVTWNGNTYASDDSATYWQGYPGYPVIAVLMLQGRVPLNMETAALFPGINWAELNAKFKRDYAKATAAVLENIECGPDEKETIAAEVRSVYEAITLLDIQVKRGVSRR